MVGFIAFIGFGEAARAFHRSLAAIDPSLRFTAYDRLMEGEGADGAFARGVCAAGVRPAVSAEAAVAPADWIFSAVTADQSHVVAEAIALHLRAGQVVFDINSVSPGRKRSNAATIERSGAHYVDMAVMAPVEPRRHRTPVLLAGTAAGTVEPELRRLDFDYRLLGSEPGSATAVKMVRSVFVKGLEAITVETLLAAERSDCLEIVRESLERSFTGLDWSRFPQYQFDRTLVHGRRRAAEMRESAATLDALGLSGALASAIAEVQDRMGAVGAADFDRTDFETLLPQVAAARVRGAGD
ncbi:NAD(P)-dependent oxidoreductase [Mangrovibrevibacter kandeliae]|uniref:NAD(P)-dependent oxidoreductase n=1 Tax=Mangrovibrevibacter kandeliae TaxID=2968473 RepID=UPI002117B58A|nr:DUF1932 domain-containing protein [Aurantimonas sp. CSK15Z-1]MCQ8782681.1 DUF1932 domain-containing protein [Aurantimonas sp. CSK15Z-1]